MNLEERVRELQRRGDIDAAKQLIRAAISCGERATYRFDGERVRVTHPAYTGSHDVRRRPGGTAWVAPRGDYRFEGEAESVDVELSAMNSRAVRFGRERIGDSDAPNVGTDAASARGEGVVDGRGVNS